MKLSFRLSLFLVMTLVSLVPILSLGLWSVHSSVEHEYQTVEEKHLLLANNISQALDRYAIDALAMAAKYWVDRIDRDQTLSYNQHKEELLDQELERFMENNIGRTQTKDRWI